MRQWANLDLLRSVAVLLVVYQHTLLYNGRADLVGWTGLTGVCFFFVHTSLVLMWSLQRDPHVGRFYLRRIFRIYPLWLVVLALVLLLRIPTSPLFAPNFGFHMPGPRELVSEILLTFNVRFGPTVVGASWTLPLEVQMYLLLPYLFFFMRSVRSLWPLLVLDVFMVFWNHAMYGPNYSALPVCVPYFLGGILAYQLSKRTQATWPAWTFPVFLFVLSGVGFRYGSYQGSWLLCLVLGLLLPRFQQLTWPPLVRTAHVLAEYSYGIYLGHFIAIAVGSFYLRHAGLPLRILGYAFTLITLPVLFFHLVERPMMRLGAKLARGRLFQRPESDLRLDPAP